MLRSKKKLNKLKYELLLEEISVSQLKEEAWKKGQMEFYAYLNGCGFMLDKIKRILDGK